MSRSERLKNVLGVEPVFDVVLSDFGRDAALRMLSEVSATERSIISKMIRERFGAEARFMDEYRQIMFCTVADLAYIKDDILSETPSYLPLPANVLYGVEGRTISRRAISRIGELIIGPVKAALERGYRRVRVVLPCNTLSHIENDLLRILRETFGPAPVHIDETDWVEVANHAGVSISVYSVPRVVLRHVIRSSESSRLMVIGTSLSREVYRATLDRLGAQRIRIVECSTEDEDRMNDLVIASIGGDRGEIADAQERLESDVIRPKQSAGNMILIEGSTDLDLGIGQNSLKMFAFELVRDVYPVAGGASEIATPYVHRVV